MKKVYSNTGYIADPHGAVGYLGLKKQGLNGNDYGIFLETAHPVKFLDVVEETLNAKVDIPTQIRDVIKKEKKSIRIDSYQKLKEFLLQ